MPVTGMVVHVLPDKTIQCITVCGLLERLFHLLQAFAPAGSLHTCPLTLADARERKQSSKGQPVTIWLRDCSPSREMALPLVWKIL